MRIEIQRISLRGSTREQLQYRYYEDTATEIDGQTCMGMQWSKWINITETAFSSLKEYNKALVEGAVDE